MMALWRHVTGEWRKCWAAAFVSFGKIASIDPAAVFRQ